MTATTAQEIRVRRAHLGLIVAMIATAALMYLVTVWLVADDLPKRLAVHFSIAGIPNDTMTTSTALVLFGAVCVGVPGLLLVVFGVGQWWRGANSRSLSAFVSGLTAGLVTLFVQLLWAHKGVVDPLDVRLTGVTAFLALTIAVGAGLLAAAALPRALPQPEPVPARPLVVGPSDRVTLLGNARTAQGALVAMAVGVIALVIATLLSDIWWLWFVAVLLAVILLSVTTFRVRIDRRGLFWRSGLGLPRGHLALANVTSVSIRDVRPGDFGGYGIRSMPGTTGLITRAGEALMVGHGERELIVTVDDAATAASVLEGLRLAAQGH